MSEHKKYGLLGRVLGHSLSPQIHELIFKYTELRGEYKLYPMEPECIKDFVLGLREKGFAGLNVTIPYKSDVLPFLGALSDKAQKIGSVNTILPTQERLYGHNTDYFGVEKMLEIADINPSGKKVMVLGSGGSARTVVALLKDIESHDILIVSRDKDAAKEKFTDVKTANYSDLSKKHGYDILINTTPVGMHPKIGDCPLDEEIIKGFGAVVDLIYNPSETKLLQAAKKHGAKTVNGLYMLVAQAVRAQEIWNSVEIDDEIIDKVFTNIKEISHE